MSNTEYTEGRLYVEDETKSLEKGERVWNYYCDTLERGYDPVLSHVAGRCKCVEPTPQGHPYVVVTAWSPGWKQLKPYLVDVPGRSGVMIHPGNNPGDSTGCILVGKRTASGFVAHSRMTFEPLYERIAQDYKDGKGVTLEIVGALNP